MAKIKKITIGDATYDICDAAATTAAANAQTRAEQNVSSINGYTYEQINNGTVMFANTAVSDSEIDAAVAALNA